MEVVIERFLGVGVKIQVISGGIDDFNNISEDYVWYKINSKPENAPSDFAIYGGFVFQMTVAWNLKLQLAINYDGSSTFIRTLWGGNWQGWKKFSFA